MVLTNYDNSFWQNDDNINLPNAVTQTANENFLLRQQKIDYFNNCSGSGQITPSSSTPPINTTNNMIPDKPVSLISSNGYYGFAHCINSDGHQPQNIVDDKFKLIAATTLTVNNHPETNLQQVMMMPTNDMMSFCHTKNGNFADKRKCDDNFGNYPGEMKRSRIENFEDNEMQTDTDMDVPNSDGDTYQQHHQENIKNDVLSTTNINQNSMNDHDCNNDDVIQFNNDRVIANKYSHSAHSINCRCRSSSPAQRSLLQLENHHSQRSNCEHNLGLEILFWHTHGALLHQQVNESYI